MRKTLFVILTVALAPFSFAVDGVVLINQSTVMAAGGFPYMISQPGSYRLSGNLTVPDANTTAIRVTGDLVTIDLNGFSIIGPTVCSNAGGSVTCTPTGFGSGVEAVLVFGQRDGSFRKISVVNGTVRGMGNVGLDLNLGFAFVEKVTALSNGGTGILFNHGTLNGNTVIENGFKGIWSFGGILNGNYVHANGADGIHCNGICTLSGNTVDFNRGGFGILVACPSTVVGNTVVFNGSQNIAFLDFGGPCVVANNAAP